MIDFLINGFIIQMIDRLGSEYFSSALSTLSIGDQQSVLLLV